jgi:hypothetical protein
VALELGDRSAAIEQGDKKLVLIRLSPEQDLG